MVADTALEAVDGADLVVLAVPVGAMAVATTEIAPGLAAGTVVTDTGSTKASVMRDVAPLIPDTCHFVPSHPIAGTEYSGPEAGFSTLFKDRYWIILPSGSPADVVTPFKAFLTATGAMVERWMSNIMTGCWRSPRICRT